MRTFLTSIIILLFSIQNGQSHPIHVSVCNIEIENDTMTLSLKLFKDDFQLAIDHNYGKEISFEDMNERSDILLLDNYIHSVLSLIANKKDSLELNYITNEINDEAIWLKYNCYVSGLRKIRIKNSVFLDLFYDQTNLVIINFQGKQSGYRFNVKNTDQLIDLR